MECAAVEFSRALLALLVSVTSADQLTPERVGAALEIPMTPLEGAAAHGVRKLEGDWIASAYLYPDVLQPAARRAHFRFQAQEPGAPLDAVCDVDFDAYAKALEAGGYRLQPRRIDEPAPYEFVRNGVVVEIGVRGKSGGDATAGCVQGIVVR